MRAFEALLAALAIGSSGPAVAQVPHTIQLSQTLVDTLTEPIKVKVTSGVACDQPAEAAIGASRTTDDYARYDQLFAMRMREAGYAVLPSSRRPFVAAPGGVKADVLVGATVRPATLGLCVSPAGQKGEILLFVDWEVYDRARNRVLWRGTTRGSAAATDFSPHGLAEIWNRAFTQAIAGLLLHREWQDPVPDDKG